MCMAAAPAPPLARASHNCRSAGARTGKGTGIGSPARTGTPRASFAARYLGGRDRFGRRPRARVPARSMTSVSNCRCSASAGSRSGRASRMARQRRSAESTKLLRETAATVTKGIGRLCSISAGFLVFLGILLT